ncbi:MAG TPA: ubiquitin-like small modifier protein 1 [Dehalococcoidia bacterium]|nr:ubiquitin-like small modifier protein 1 [Dehalococcoidia bacterium]
MGLVRLYATLRERAGGERAVEVPWSPGETVGAVLRRLIERWPGLDGYILDDRGDVQRFVNVFVDGRDIRYLDGLDTKLEDREEISVFPPVAGG